MSAHIHSQLLGLLTVTQDGEQRTRFRTQKTASLLGYLACFLHRSHPREELIDLFWPNADLGAGRSSLRTALASLRRQLEPPGVVEGTVLMADRLSVRLQSESVSTDVDAFERTLQRARRTEDLRDRERELSAAIALYGGPLLSGFYDDWVLRERTRLEQSYILALRDLVATLETLEEWEPAIEMGHRLVVAEPLSEEGHLTLIRLYAALGQTSAARRQFRWMVAYALMGMARMELFMGHMLPARDMFLQSLCILRDGGAPHRIASALLFLAQIAAKSGRLEPAVRLLGAVQGIEQAMDWTLTPGEWANYDADIAAARTALGEAQFDRFWAEGNEAALQEILDEEL